VPANLATARDIALSASKDLECHCSDLDAVASDMDAGVRVSEKLMAEAGGLPLMNAVTFVPLSRIHQSDALDEIRFRRR